jgi:hypothetical protein
MLFRSLFCSYTSAPSSWVYLQAYSLHRTGVSALTYTPACVLSPLSCTEWATGKSLVKAWSRRWWASLRKIGQLVNKTHSTVQNIVNKFKYTESIENVRRRPKRRIGYSAQSPDLTLLNICGPFWKVVSVEWVLDPSTIFRGNGRLSVPKYVGI